MTELLANPSFLPLLLFAGLPFFLLVVSVLTVRAVYFLSLKTIRVSFKDIRDVDSVLDYFIRDMGFDAPQKEDNVLQFRFTRWIMYPHHVVRLKAALSGNRVILTGPLHMIRRVEKRMLSFSDL